MFLIKIFVSYQRKLAMTLPQSVVGNGATWGKLEPTTKIKKQLKILNFEFCLSFEYASG